jgi:hypothetical protein
MVKEICQGHYLPDGTFGLHLFAADGFGEAELAEQDLVERLAGDVYVEIGFVAVGTAVFNLQRPFLGINQQCSVWIRNIEANAHFRL